MMGRKILVFSLFLASSASADTVLILGNHRLANAFSSDPANDVKIQRDDTCTAIRTARSLGQEVFLLTPSISCSVVENGVPRVERYEGRCGDVDCSKAKVAAELKRLGQALRKDPDQNLMIQTVGHGIRNPYKNPAPEANGLGIGQEDLSAAEFAKMLVSAGIPENTDKIRGLWFQCYSGGWNEIARLIDQPGKVCSVSHSLHTLQASVTKEEYTSEKMEGRAGSAFIQGFWDSQRTSGGAASLADSTMSSAALLRGLTEKVLPSDQWRASSMSLFERATRSGPYSISNSKQDGFGEDFSRGFDLDGIDVFERFKQGLGETRSSSSALRDRYAKHVDSVVRDVESRSTILDFFRSESREQEKARRISGAYLMRSSSCYQPMIHSVEPAIARLRGQLSDLERFAERAESDEMRKTLLAKASGWKSGVESARKEYGSEVDRYHKRLNRALARSGALMKSMRTGKAKDYSEFKKWEKEYADIEKEFREIGSLKNFPAMKTLASIARESEQTRDLLSAITRDGFPSSERARIIAAWNCENSAVFKTKGVK